MEIIKQHVVISYLLGELDESELVGLWNDYQAHNNYDGIIYTLNEENVNECLNGKTPFEIISLSLGNNTICKPYFYFNAYGDFVPTDLCDSPFDIGQLVEYCVEYKQYIFDLSNLLKRIMEFSKCHNTISEDDFVEYLETEEMDMYNLLSNDDWSTLVHNAIDYVRAKQ